MTSNHERQNFFYRTHNGQCVSQDILGAICEAAVANNPSGLQALLSSPEGRAVPREWRVPEQIAVAHGHQDCLSVLSRCGFAFDNNTWCYAANRGHLHLLQPAVRKNHVLDDNVFNAAFLSSHVACVDYLIQLGLPHTPYFKYDFPLTRGQLSCVELMLDKGAAIDPETLLRAAGHGDVDCVRALHKGGVPLWHTLRHEPYSLGLHTAIAGPGALTIFRRPQDLEPLFTTMRYASLHGAPVSPHLEKLFRRKRQLTQSVLRCFKAAERQSKRRGALASMAAVPTELVEVIIDLADLEIPEIMKRPCPASHSAPARAH